MILLGWLAFLALVVTAVLVTWSRTLALLFPEKIRTLEVDYVTTPDLWKLRVCRYRKERSHGEPVLLVHGLNANQNNFTAPADNCLADYLSEHGYDCWTVDLRGTRSSRPPVAQGRETVTVEDFVWRDLPAVIAHIQKATGSAKIHYVGHSLGGFLLYAYVQAFGADKIASGTALGAPTKFSDVTSVVPKFLVRMALRCPYAGEMLRCGLPFAKLAGTGISAFPINPNNIAPGMGLADLYPIIEDPAPLVHAQVFSWADRGEITLRQDSLNVTQGYAAMKFPLLAIYGPADPFVRPEAGKAFFESIKNEDKKMIVCSRENGCSEDYNHCDLSFGREGTREVFEPIGQWIKAHPIAGAAKAAEKPVEVKVAAVAAKAPEAAKEVAAPKAAPVVKEAVAPKAPEATKAAPLVKEVVSVKVLEAVKSAAAVKATPAPKEAVAAKAPEATKETATVKAAPAVKAAAPAKAAETAKPAPASPKKAAAAKAPVVKKAAAVKKPAAAKAAAPAKPAAAAKKPAAVKAPAAPAKAAPAAKNKAAKK